MKLLVRNTQKQVSLSWQGEIVGQSWPGSRRGGGSFWPHSLPFLSFLCHDHWVKGYWCRALSKPDIL